MTIASGRPARVLLADDHELVRAGLQAQLQQLGRFAIVQAWDRHTLLRAAATPPPCDLALVDLNMPGMNGAEGIAALGAAHPELPVIVITGISGNDALAQSRAWRQCSNVKGVVHKTGRAQALRELIDAVLARTTVQLPTLLGAEMPPDPCIDRLTPRQIEVALAASAGKTNQQIGHALGLTEGTVKNHLQVAFRVLGVSNRTQMALRLRALKLDRS